MTDQLRFDGRVAVVTGAGGGLGREYALLLAGRGAQVVVNDLGGSVHGDGATQRAADGVVEEITLGGGEAVANYDSVEDGEKIVQQALDQYGKVDIIVNNAGILRDRTFHKMSVDDWEAVYRVHLYGAFKTTHAAWPHLREKGYGRVIMTASSSGIYGNFGQANYGAMKLALMGLANTLAIEGAKYNIFVNTIAPIAASRMTDGLVPEPIYKAIGPERVAPLVAYLCHEQCSVSGRKFEVGANWAAEIRWQRTSGLRLPLAEKMTPEHIAEHWDSLTDFSTPDYPVSSLDAFQIVDDQVKSG
ncbi:MAG: SDR family oxidoreductase [Ardenticatenaceae bacterium]|nr:SDR family oxidoreductase [Ardenticatenaceae bacterium]